MRYPGLHEARPGLRQCRLEGFSVAALLDQLGCHGAYPASARTFPRNTQYDQPVYIKMIGSRNSVPISRNACDCGAAAASHRVIVGATTYGNRLIASPR